MARVIERDCARGLKGLAPMAPPCAQRANTGRARRRVARASRGGLRPGVCSRSMALTGTAPGRARARRGAPFAGHALEARPWLAAAAAKHRYKLLQRRAPDGCVALAGPLPNDVQIGARLARLSQPSRTPR